MKITTKLWVGLGVLAALSPLGLILPERFKATDAWGEWGAESVKDLAGYIPRGLERISSFWSAPLPDYAFKGWEEKGLPQLGFAYIISAALGIIICAAVIFLIGKALVKKGG